jgi:hypothetical protein
MGKMRGRNSQMIISDEVSGNDMIRAHQEIGKLQGSVDHAAERLAVSWSAEEIVNASNRTPSCTCLSPVTNILVHPDVAYALAAKAPHRSTAEAGVTAIAAQYGGKVPLYTLGKVLGPWDSLIEELVPRRRG